MGTSRSLSHGCFHFLGKRKPGLEPGVRVGRGMGADGERGAGLKWLSWPRGWSVEGVLGNI